MRVARICAAMMSLAALSAPLAVSAQQAQSAPPTAINAPSYARPANPNGEDSIAGRISSIDGKFALRVRDDRGFIDNIELHQGTIINPTGLTLQPGMRVTILGYNRGKAFAAHQIDTPYESYGLAYPAYPFYGGYPAYPAYSIGFGFGPVYSHHWR